MKFEGTFFSVEKNVSVPTPPPPAAPVEATMSSGSDDKLCGLLAYASSKCPSDSKACKKCVIDQVAILRISVSAKKFCKKLPGADVMIRIFCDFSRFSAKKLAFFLGKYQCYDQPFSKFSFVLSQNAYFFAKFFGENIFKIITSVPETIMLGERSQRVSLPPIFFAGKGQYCLELALPNWLQFVLTHLKPAPLK
jgi:hypothetical protein